MKILLSILPLYLMAIEPNFGQWEGSAVIFDLNTTHKEVVGTFNDEPLNPCSTFKILNSMIALDTKVVLDEAETIAWDRIVREYDVWNKDHSMKSAISVSAVWFYQELARRIGKERMQMMVAKAHYGNSDTSKTLIDFWLGNGSLKISVNEQVDFLARWMNDVLPFSTHTMHRVKEMIIIEKNQNLTFAGKTGTCGGVGWFVGYVESPLSTKVFAFALKGEKASGLEAKRIAYEFFNKQF